MSCGDIRKEAMVDIGRNIRAATLENQNGEKITLDGPNRKVVFFFPKASTPG